MKGKWDMDQQICPNCEASNPIENRYCGRCGASLNRYAIVPSPRRAVIPAQKPWQSLAQAPAARAAAVGLGTILLRLAVAWLRRRSEQPAQPVLRRQSAPHTISEHETGFLTSGAAPVQRIIITWWRIWIE